MIESVCIVTGEDKYGRSCVLSRKKVEFTKEIANVGKWCDLWRTDTSPPDIPVTEARATSLDADAVPSASGTKFGLVIMMPDAQMSAEDRTMMLAAMDRAEGVQREGGGSSMMHRTDTIDYLVVLSGEIHLALEREEVLARAGDFVIQGGGSHRWTNRSSKPAVVAGVMIGAQRARKRTDPPP